MLKNVYSLHWQSVKYTIMRRKTKMNLFLYKAYSYVLSSFYLNTVTIYKKKKKRSTYPPISCIIINTTTDAYYEIKPPRFNNVDSFRLTYRIKHEGSCYAV